MSNPLDLAEVGSLLGDPTRAIIMTVSMDGRAHTAGELAYFARVTPQTISEHLKRLVEGRLLTVVKQGRHRYFRIESPLVAQMMESLGAVAAIQTPPRHRGVSRADDALKYARLCYDHLAGALAVMLADSLTAKGFVSLERDGGAISQEGRAFFNAAGIDLEPPEVGRRTFCRPCLDWTERRFHIAGHAGAALARHFMENRWVERVEDSRAVEVSDFGRDRFARVFDLDLDELQAVA